MPIRLLYVVALLEWFSTLAVEIIAMRMAIPVVGSSIILTSIFLWVILLALSFGYWSWWILSSKLEPNRLPYALWSSLLFAWVWYVIISFTLQRWFLEFMMNSSGSYILTLFLVSAVLFFPPVFIASHTIPLLTEMLNEPSKWKAAWTMLFASTVWSFLGSVLTSILFFARRWVSLTWVIVWVMLIFLAAIVFSNLNRIYSLICLVVWLLIFIFFWWFGAQNESVFSYDNAYQNIKVYDALYKSEDIRVFSLDGSLSSAIYKDDKKPWTPFKYVNEALRVTDILQPKRILVIWAAWFTYPEKIATRKYVDKVDTIDIDPDVKNISEKYFFERELNKKIEFYPYSARWVLTNMINDSRKYDLVFLDAYTDKSIPVELVTKEFFESINLILEDWWTLIANLILDKQLESKFSHRTLATMSSIFDQMYYTNITDNEGYNFDNFIVSSTSIDSFWSWNETWSEKIYTDNKSSASLDSVRMLYSKPE